MNLIDLAGAKIGRLTVISRSTNDLRGKARWNCICDCGEKTIVRRADLRRRGGGTKSCGCLIIERTKEANSRHGMTHSPTWESWNAMHGRCKYPSVNSYELYGGRGIKVCERWSKFENFYSDMGPRPSPNHSIDRRDGNGHYEPANCRWATAKEQRANRRDGVCK